ncbi:hypothetical protein CRG98_041227 [Punica granatum]|uniref:Uncharacterized protein n=1 Tax=Punica granatum TaxID=22663 RepID=A0A2I0I350_PUNGR|nr:hypothetical protein CRG98_041227 [Punica granatum]
MEKEANLDSGESHGTLDHIPKEVTERSLGSSPDLRRSLAPTSIVSYMPHVPWKLTIRIFNKTMPSRLRACEQTHETNMNIIFSEICNVTLVYSTPNLETYPEKPSASRKEKSVASEGPRDLSASCKERGRELPSAPPSREDLSSLDPEYFSSYYHILVVVRGITAIKTA